MDDKMRVPHVIHYCWFGGDPLPEFAKRCIESWRTFCPEYEIIEWNESNYDLNACPFVQEAYQAKKWAFVSDYARFDILYHHGGVYFDTDVELVKTLDDILEEGPFFAMEQQNANDDKQYVGPGLGMAAAAGHVIYEEILSEYCAKHFINGDGTYNQITIGECTTRVLKQHGLTDAQDPQCVEGIWIYPWDYFCPLKYGTEELTITPNTHAIHHYSATWFTKEEQAALRFTIRTSKLLGTDLSKRLGRIYNFPYRVRMKIKQKGIWGTVRLAIQKLTR